MVALSRITMTDISRQKKLDVGLDGELTPSHTVGQTIEHYVDRMGIRNTDLRWSAFSRGVKLDNKSKLMDVPESEEQVWTVMPEIAAGSH